MEQSGIATNNKAGFCLTLGVKGDKTVKKYAARIPAHAQGYYLEITPKGAVIAGADEAGVKRFVARAATGDNGDFAILRLLAIHDVVFEIDLEEVRVAEGYSLEGIGDHIIGVIDEFFHALILPLLPSPRNDWPHPSLAKPAINRRFARRCQ